MIETIGIGAAPDDGTGDTWRAAATKCNTNFAELVAADAALTGLITSADTAMDVRVDALEATKQRGAFSYQAGTAITITPLVISTFYPIPGVAIFTLSDAVGFASSNNGVNQFLQKIDAGMQTYYVNGFVSIKKTLGGVDVLEARIAKNGIALTSKGAISDAAGYAMVQISGFVSLAQNDTISVVLANNTALATIDINRCFITAIRV